MTRVLPECKNEVESIHVWKAQIRNDPIARSFFKKLEQSGCVVKIFDEVIAFKCDAEEMPDIGIVVQHGNAILSGFGFFVARELL